MMLPRIFLSKLTALVLGGLLLAGVPALAQTLPTGPAPVAPDLENMLVLDLSTGGRVTIQMFPAVAPAHVERIKTLTRQGFYNGVIFHRVIEGFMAQTGDPTGTGRGGASIWGGKFEDEITRDLKHTGAGIICMANREGIDLQVAFDRMMEKVERRDANRWTRRPGEPGTGNRERET